MEEESIHNLELEAFDYINKFMNHKDFDKTRFNHLFNTILNKKEGIATCYTCLLRQFRELENYLNGKK